MRSSAIYATMPRCMWSNVALKQYMSDISVAVNVGLASVIVSFWLCTISVSVSIAALPRMTHFFCVHQADTQHPSLYYVLICVCLPPSMAIVLHPYNATSTCFTRPRAQSLHNPNSDLNTDLAMPNLVIISLHLHISVRAAPHDPSLSVDNVGRHFGDLKCLLTADISQNYGMDCRPTMLAPQPHGP